MILEVVDRQSLTGSSKPLHVRAGRERAARFRADQVVPSGEDNVTLQCGADLSVKSYMVLCRAHVDLITK